MKNTFLIFDTETSGLVPKNRNYTDTFHFDKNNCRIVSIAWKICTIDSIIKDSYYIVRPNGFKIPDVCIRVHGITNEHALEEGEEIEDVLNYICEDIKKYNVSFLVAHNIEFDRPLLLNELYRMNHQDLMVIEKKHYLCTMIAGMELFNLGKYPKLIELVKLLYPDRSVKEMNEKAHNASWDTEACFDCFKEIYKRAN